MTNARSKPVRVDDDTFELVKTIAEDEDRPMTRVVRSSVEMYDQVRLAKATVPSTSGGQVPDITTSQVPDHPESEPSIADCLHPKARQRKLSWGTVCRDCGTVLK